MKNDYPTLNKHFPECFKSIQASIINSNDQAQAKISQIIQGFNQRIDRTADDLEITRLKRGKTELYQLLKATVQQDIDSYLSTAESK